MDENKTGNDGQKENADGTTTLCGVGKGCPDGTHPHTYGVGQKPNDTNTKVGKITDPEYHG